MGQLGYTMLWTGVSILRVMHMVHLAIENLVSSCSFVLGTRNITVGFLARKGLITVCITVQGASSAAPTLWRITVKRMSVPGS